MNCAEARELTAAYVLRALEPDEQRELEAHVAGCDLHEEIAGLRAAALAISGTAPDREPPPALREGLLARAAGRSGGHAVQPERAAREGRPVLGWLQMEQAAALLAGLAAAFAAIAVALGMWVAVLLGGDDGSSALVRRVSEDAIEARLVYVAEDATATLAIGGLTALGADEDYQLWVIRDGTPVGRGRVRRRRGRHRWRELPARAARGRRDRGDDRAGRRQPAADLGAAVLDRHLGPSAASVPPLCPLCAASRSAGPGSEARRRLLARCSPPPHDGGGTA